MNACGSDAANLPSDHDSGSDWRIISFSRSNAATNCSSRISPSSGKSSQKTSDGSIWRGMFGSQMQSCRSARSISLSIR
ncbi:hypothetical protein D3C75_1347630 [compost metagenome]